MAANHYPASGSEIMPTLPMQDAQDMPADPYEMNFNDEPPPKMKRRPPKEPKPKKPKSPKLPKSPKAKKPKKGKKSLEEAAPDLEPFPVLPDYPLVKFLVLSKLQNAKDFNKICCFLLSLILKLLYC